MAALGLTFEASASAGVKLVGAQRIEASSAMSATNLPLHCMQAVGLSLAGLTV